MKSLRTIIVMCIVLSVLSCQSDNKTIRVSELLRFASEQQHIDYDRLLQGALTGNEDSIKKLALLDFKEAAGYDHGSVIVDLINCIGEDAFIYSLGTLDKTQQLLLWGYVEAGLEYNSNPDSLSCDFKDAFPKLFLFLSAKR